MSERLRVLRGGEGDEVLVLLHGLGATSEVWTGLRQVLADQWPGRWIAPDFPGHGGSSRLPVYSFGHLAAAVSQAIPPASRVVVLGHSLGGVVGLALASGWFGVPVAAVCGVGIKVQWTPEELARTRAFSTRPNPVYPTRAEAAERHLKVSGLAGLILPDAVPDAALVQGDSGWTLAFDPGAFTVGAPDMPGLLGAARAPVTLAVGGHDPMCPPDQLLALRSDSLVLPGLGHNPHVEAPAALVPLLERLTTR